jgi:hypothetical protein
LEKTPTSNHNDLSNLDYLSTNNGIIPFQQDTPFSQNNEGFQNINSNKDTPTTASVVNRKNIEKSKLI